MSLATIAEYIKCHKDYPSVGIHFQDIRPLFNAPYEIKQYAMQQFADKIRPLKPTVLIGLESRGRELVAELSNILRVRYVIMVKESSKLAGQTVSSPQGTSEYGSSAFKLGIHDLFEHDKCVIVDDLAATYGTSLVAVQLLHQLKQDHLHGNMTVVGVANFIELCEITGQEANVQKLTDMGIPMVHLLQYKGQCLSFETCASNPPNTSNISHSSKISHLSKGSKISHPPNSNLHRNTFQSGRTPRFILFHHPSMQQLANLLVNSFPSVFEHGFIEWGKFNDQSHDIKFDSHIMNRDVMFLGSTDSTVLIEQVAICIALPRQNIRSLVMCFPFLTSGTMERVDEEGILAMGEPMLKILTNSIPLTQTGPAKLQIFDLHASVEQFYITENVTMDRPMLSAVPLILNEMKFFDGVYVAFPDDGAAKRYKHWTHKDYQHKLIVCSKIRKCDARYITITQGMDYDVEQVKNIFILDDLVQSGSTLYESMIAIRKVYPHAKIHAFVTHAVFPNHGYRHFLTGQKYAGFNTFYITNTIESTVTAIDTYASGIDSPFQILNIAPLICERMTQHINGNMPDPRIIVTSNNKDKFKAAHRIFESVYGESVSIIMTPSPSGVPEQPRGYDEIKQGALGRYCNSDSHPKYAAISFENGLVAKTEPVDPNLRSGTVLDYCYVFIRIGDKKEDGAFSIPVSVSSELVNQIGEGETIGTVMNRTCGYDSSSWHQFFYPFLDRTEIMTRTGRRIVRRLLS